MKSAPREQRVVAGTERTGGGWKTLAPGDCAVINDATYSPKEAWLFVNSLDTVNITENRISEIQHLVAEKHTIPSRARRKVQPGYIVVFHGPPVPTPLPPAEIPAGELPGLDRLRRHSR